MHRIDLDNFPKKNKFMLLILFVFTDLIELDTEYVDFDKLNMSLK